MPDNEGANTNAAPGMNIPDEAMKPGVIETPKKKKAATPTVESELKIAKAMNAKLRAENEQLVATMQSMNQQLINSQRMYGKLREFTDAALMAVVGQLDTVKQTANVLRLKGGDL